MDLGQIFQNFQYADLQWVVPVLAGLVIIVGALLAGIIRGMSAGVIIALFFGGLMALSPTLVTLFQPRSDPHATETARVTESVAALAQLNTAVATDLSRVITTVRTSLASLEPLVQAAANANGAGIDAAQFSRTLQDTETRLDQAIDSLSSAGNARAQLEDDLQALQVEMRRLNLVARRADQ